MPAPGIAVNRAGGRRGHHPGPAGARVRVRMPAREPVQAARAFGGAPAEEKVEMRIKIAKRKKSLKGLHCAGADGWVVVWWGVWGTAMIRLGARDGEGGGA